MTDCSRKAAPVPCLGQVKAIANCSNIANCLPQKGTGTASLWGEDTEGDKATFCAPGGAEDSRKPLGAAAVTSWAVVAPEPWCF